MNKIVEKLDYAAIGGATDSTICRSLDFNSVVPSYLDADVDMHINQLYSYISTYFIVPQQNISSGLNPGMNYLCQALAWGLQYVRSKNARYHLP